MVRARQPCYWKDALSALSKADPVMATLCDRYKGEWLVGKHDAFKTLARAVVGQQISVQAADRIWTRFEARVVEVSPERVVVTSENDLRSSGLTRMKASYIHDIAKAFKAGRFDLTALTDSDDQSAVDHLVTFRGIGRWTAEMFLIFYLQRPDVLPINDVGLQRAMVKHYGRNFKGAPSLIESHAEQWRPWRSVAVWYLWRSLDPLPVSY